MLATQRRVLLGMVILCGWLWRLVALAVFTDATVDVFLDVVLFFGGVVIGVVWFGCSVGVPAVFQTPRMRWIWLSVPVLGVGCIGFGLDNNGLMARVWLCENALREHAEWVRENPKAEPKPQRVGLFWVRSVSASEGHAYLTTATGLFEEAGVVYCPDGNSPAPPSGSRHRSYKYQHLYGPWWWWRQISD